MVPDTKNNQVHKDQTGRINLTKTNPFHKRPLISLCTTVKDRLAHLQQTFLRNMNDNENYRDCEFLLLNYSCPNPQTEEWVRRVLGSYITSGRVNYYYYPNSLTFDRSHARNLAFRVAQGDIICNIDADNFTGKSFVAYVSASLSFEDSFLCGPVDGRGLAGRICVRRKDWESVGGFDERFKSYGYEDIDFTNRLSMIGLTKKKITNEKFCKSIAHSSKLRMQHHLEDRRRENIAIMESNIEQGIACPNGSSFGHGRVKKNFSYWLEV